MKKLTIAEYPGVTHTLVENTSIRNIGYYNNRYYWVEVWFDFEYHLQPHYVLENDLTTSFNDGGSAYLNADGSVLLRVLSSHIYVAGGSSSNFATAQYDGANWSFGSLTAVGKVADIVIVNAYVTLIYTNGTTLYFYDFNSNFSVSTLTIKANGFYAGKVIGIYYYFVYVNAADEMVLASFTRGAGSPGTLVDIETLTTTLPATLDMNQQQYWISGNVEYIIDQDHLYYRVNGRPWTSYASSGSTSTGIVWTYDDSDNYEIKYIIWNDKIHIVLPNGTIAAISSFSNDARIGFDWFFVDCVAETIYSFLISDFTNVSFCQNALNHFKSPNLSLLCETEPSENLYIILYDDSDNEIYEGFVQSYNIDVNSVYTYIMIHAAEYDFNQDVDEIFINKTTDEMLTTLLDTYASFLHYITGSISTAPTTQHSVVFKGKKLLFCIKWLCQAEGYQFSVRPDLTVYFDTYTSSGITISDKDNIGILPERSVKRLKLSRVILSGKYTATGRLQCVVLGEPNYGSYSASFPDLDGTVDATTGLVTSGPLYDMAQAILTNKNVVLTTLHFSVRGKTQVNLGQTIQLGFASGNTTGATATGSVDLSGGKNWSIDIETFLIKYDNGITKTITLNANCANLAAVKVEIQSALDAEYTDSEFIVGDDGSNHVTLIPKTNHYYELISGDALTTIGWTAQVYGQTYYVAANLYNAKTDESELVCHDALYINIEGSTEENLQNNIDVVAQDIEQTLSGEHTHQLVNVSHPGYFTGTKAGELFKSTANGDTPTGWTNSIEGTCVATVVSSYSGHTKCLKIDCTVLSGGSVGVLYYTIASVSNLEYSRWVYIPDLTNLYYFDLRSSGGTNAFRVQFNAGTLSLVGASSATIGYYTAAGWYYILVDYNKNTTSYAWVYNSTCFRWYGSITAGNQDITRIQFVQNVVSAWYVDAMAFDFEDGWFRYLGWADGQITAKGFVDSVLQRPIDDRDLLDFSVIGFDGFAVSPWFGGSNTVILSDTNAEVRCTTAVRRTGSYYIIICVYYTTSIPTNNVDVILYLGTYGDKETNAYNLINGTADTLTKGTAVAITYHKILGPYPMTAMDTVHLIVRKTDNCDGDTGYIRIKYIWAIEV